MAGPRRMKFPRLPKVVQAAGGPVKVVLVKRPRDHDDAKHRPRKTPCWGTYSASRRLIEIDEAVDRQFQWHTLWHEWTHVALMDSGVAEILDTREEEAICEALATARMREMFGFSAR